MILKLSKPNTDRANNYNRLIYNTWFFKKYLSSQVLSSRNAFFIFMADTNVLWSFQMPGANANKFLAGKLEKKRRLGKVGADRRIILRQALGK
jgi:hypothetical protein